MGAEHQNRTRAAEEAALWLIRLEHEDSAQTRVGFDAWVSKGALNLEEFLFAKRALAELEQLNGSYRLSNEMSPQASVTRLPGRDGIQAHLAPDWGWNRWMISIAACFTLMVAGVIVFILSPKGGERYTTPIGSQQTLKLGDGSMVYLNTDSVAEVGFSQDARVIRLVKGEALFAVARDARRPFIVETDRARIQAIGTQFNVRADAQSTRVAVIEGVVQVGKNVRLAAGEEARVAENQIVKTATPDVQRIVAWRGRRLVFENTRVDEIANEFNRYNPIPIRIEGDAIRSLTMGGTFDADDSSPLIRYLMRDPNVMVTRSASQIRIYSRGQ